MGPQLLTKRLTAGRAGILFHEAPRAGGDEGGCMAGKPRYEERERPRGSRKCVLTGRSITACGWSIATFGSLRDEWPSRRLPVVRH
jgi:hypothetical protein